MALINIAPTKSGLLTARRLLAVAEEGYDLLEQKRQILIFELMSRLNRAKAVARQVQLALPPAFSALHDAMLDKGSEAVDQAALGIPCGHQVEINRSYLMGLRLPRVTAHIVESGLVFGVVGTSGHTDLALKRFMALLPALCELAELQNAIAIVAHELRRTQRRCNALSRIFIPAYRSLISTISATVEERERESFVITKLIRNRLAEGAVRS